MDVQQPESLDWLVHPSRYPGWQLQLGLGYQRRGSGLGRLNHDERGTALTYPLISPSITSLSQNSATVGDLQCDEPASPVRGGHALEAAATHSAGAPDRLWLDRYSPALHPRQPAPGGSAFTLTVNGNGNLLSRYLACHKKDPFWYSNQPVSALLHNRSQVEPILQPSSMPSWTP